MNILPSGRRTLSLMTWLLLGCWLLQACTAQKHLEDSSLLPAPYLAQPNEGLIYNAAFCYKDFHASGLLVMKRMEPSVYHVVLLSKFGPSLMEFKLYEDSIHWIKTFEQLQKKSVEKLMERDFRLLLLSELDHPKTIRSVRNQNSKPIFCVKGAMKSKVVMEPETKRVLYSENRQWFNPVKTKTYFQYDQQPVPSKISLEHSHVNMSLELNLLKVKHAEE